MTSVSKMASKDVCGSDHDGIISLLEMFYLTFQ
jgi:hypothetical protein